MVKQVYSAYLKSKQELMTVASGGAATALSIQMIKKGGYVVGVRYNEDFRSNRYCIVKNINELELLKGSKYADVRLETTNCNRGLFLEVKDLLESRDILFIGLPCVVAGLKNFLKNYKIKKQLITVALICHGPVPSIIQEQYVSYLEKRYQSKLQSFSVRYKKDEWLPVYLYAKFENGKVFCEKFYKTEFGFAFSVYGKKSCYSCLYKESNRMEDLTIGDFWGLNETNPIYNRYGTSVIISRTEKGHTFLMQNEDMILHKADFDTAVKGNPMLIKSRIRHKEYDKFEKLLYQKGLIYAARHCSFKQDIIKNKIKKIFLKMIN